MKYDFEKFKQLYNKFVNHYNSHKNGLTAFAQITSVRSGIEQRQADLKKSINGFIDKLDDGLSYICSGGPFSEGEMNNIDWEKKSRLSKLKDQIVVQVKREVNSSLFSDEMLQRSTDALNDFYKKAGKSERVGESVICIQEIITFGKKLTDTNYHLNGIIAVTGKIVDMGYPDELSTYESLTLEEQNQLQGIAATNVDKFNKSLEEHWPKLKPAIFKAMGNKPFSKIFKEKGKTVGKEFTHHVYTKYDGVNIYTLQKWLDREDVRDKIWNAYQSKTTAEPH